MFQIVAFYAFREVADVDAAVERLERAVAELDLLGSILVASEGVNGTVARAGDLESFVGILRGEFGVDDRNIKFASAPEAPFRKATVRRKREIVALGVDGVDPNARVGTYVGPDEWDALIEQEDLLLIDCRNSYEYEVGTFEGAVDPRTDAFSEFPEYVDSLDPSKTPRVAMFCTGGIRCEKASSYLLERGFDEVYHLQGGILAYLEKRGQQPNKWRGECFVFDRRVSVTPELEPGHYDICFACRMPLSASDKEHELYEEGVSCARCFDKFTEAERAAKRERHRAFITDGLAG